MSSGAANAKSGTSAKKRKREAQKRNKRVFLTVQTGMRETIPNFVLEGLLTAYEMELRDGTPLEYRKQLFPSLLRSYLSTRKLSDAECVAAWEIYTLYNSLWFTKVLYNENSLDKLVSAEKYDEANKLLYQMLIDIAEPNDERFRGI